MLRNRVVFHGCLDNRSPALNEPYQSSEILLLASYSGDVAADATARPRLVAEGR